MMLRDGEGILENRMHSSVEVEEEVEVEEGM